MIFTKTKIEILNIVYLIFNNLHEVRYVSNEMLNYLTLIIEIYVLERETKEVRSKISNIRKLFIYFSFLFICSKHYQNQLQEVNFRRS